MSGWSKIAIEVMKASMKPGFLYGVSEDGDLYCIKAKMPKPGETMIMPPFHMPKEYASDKDINVPIKEGGK